MEPCPEASKDIPCGASERLSDEALSLQQARRQRKEQAKAAKMLHKMSVKGSPLEKHTAKGVTVMRTLVPPDNCRIAKHPQQRKECVTCTVEPIVSTIASSDGCANPEGGMDHEKAPQQWIVTSVVRHMNDDHLDWFWRRSSLRDLGRDMFPNVKEISESVSAYRMVIDYMDKQHIPYQSPGHVKIICVADGSSPRTASLFATFLPQSVYSVDPLMHSRYIDEVDAQGANVPKYRGTLRAYAETIEDFVSKLQSEEQSRNTSNNRDGDDPEVVVITCVHSHAFLEDFVPQLRRCYGRCRFLLLAIPCCIEQLLAFPIGQRKQKRLARQCMHPSLHPVYETMDMGIHSDDRMVRLWDLPPVCLLQEESAKLDLLELTKDQDCPEVREQESNCGLHAMPTSLVCDPMCLFESMRVSTDSGGVNRRKLVSDMYNQHSRK